MPGWLGIYRWRIILCVVPSGVHSAWWSKSMPRSSSQNTAWKSSVTVSIASHDGDTLVWFPVLTKSLWTRLSHLPSKHGEGVEGEVLSLSLLWKLFRFESNNYRFIRERWRDREKARLNMTLLVRFSHLEEEGADLGCSPCSNDYLTFYPVAV